METKEINWTAVKNDMFGGPRFVCHFLELITDEEANLSVPEKYAIACARAVKLGGRKYSGRDYGGGIVFRTYNVKETEKKIKEAMNKTVRYKYTMPDGSTGYKDFLYLDVASEKNAGKPKRTIHLDGVLYSRIN